jgi:hypothetical protein
MSGRRGKGKRFSLCFVFTLLQCRLIRFHRPAELNLSDALPEIEWIISNSHELENIHGRSGA